MIRIDAAQFKAHLQICPKSDVRNYLNGTRFEVCANGDAFLITTDGQMLLVTKLPPKWTGDAFDAPQAFTIPRDDIERAIKGVNGELLLTPTVVGQVAFKGLEGTYPEWRRVIPKEGPCVGLNFNPLLLAKMKKAFMYLKAGPTQMFSHENNGGQAVFTAEKTNAIGVVMCLRGGTPVWDMPFAIPSFR